MDWLERKHEPIVPKENVKLVTSSDNRIVGWVDFAGQDQRHVGD